MTESDQPRPDLDAAVDAVLPALTAVSDDAAAASRRRTRTALAGDRREGGLGSWRWAVPAAALPLAALAAFAWWPTAPAGDGPRIVVNAPAPATSPPPPTPSPVAPSVSAPPPIVPTRAAPAPRPSRGRRSVPVQATSAMPTTPESSGSDPLIALVRAVQRIPEDAWQRSTTLAAEPVSVPDVSFAPIDVAPLETLPIADMSAEPLAPGEP